MSLRLSLLVASLLLPVAGRAADVVLNEYNAVTDAGFLNGGTPAEDSEGGQAADPFFGRVAGNGGDWFELVVITDHLDVRGWQLAIAEGATAGPTLTLTQHPLWSDLRSGTIVTIAEGVADDPSYDPAGGDWWINVRAAAAGTGTYLSALDFPVGNSDWQLTIRDAGGAVVFGPAGEGVSPASGIGGTEVMKLEGTPSAAITPASGLYNDGTSSTFGAPNCWSSCTQVQDFSALRGSGPPPDPTAAMYDPTRVLEIAIDLAPDDWNQLRAQQRTFVSLLGDQCLAQPFASPFTWFPATVTIDGQMRANAGVRKKGFLGSLSTLKPALKIDLGEFQDNPAVYGLKKLTLNNAVQDAALVRQCLGYQLFARAGVPASRCNFARVTVNGADLGIFVNVEEIRAPMLARHFADNSGNLYEGTVSDFHPGLVDTFEAQTNEDEADRSELRAVIDALQADTAALPAAVGALVDLDAFSTYWAMEALLGHWDGYTSNRNNFYVYHDPTSGKLRFLPWGIDGILYDGRPLGATAAAPNNALFAYSALARRLLDVPETWLFYAAKMLTLLDTVWDESAILAEIDRMQALLAPYTGDLAAPLAGVRSFVSGRRGRIAQELGAGAPSIEPLAVYSPCLVANGSLRAGFVAFWGTADTVPELQTGFATLAAQVGFATLAVQVDGTAPKPVLSAAAAGLSPLDPNPRRGVINLYYWLSDGTIGIVTMTVDPTLLVTGATLPVDGQVVDATFYVFGGGSLLPAGFLDQGTLHLDAASITPGGWIQGTLEATTFLPGFTPLGSEAARAAPASTAPPGQ
jgi:hypothetical protein